MSHAVPIAEHLEGSAGNGRAAPPQITHRRIQHSDALVLADAIRRSHKHLRGYIGWAQYAGTWNFRQIQLFVNDHVTSEFPREHFLFFQGKQLVGMGSLAPMAAPFEIQIALWVTEGFHGRGIGTHIASTLEKYAFEVRGYDRLYYQHDAYNESSKRLPQKLRFRFSHTFDADIQAQDESGFWFSWVKHRPEPPQLSLLDDNARTHAIQTCRADNPTRKTAGSDPGRGPTLTQSQRAQLQIGQTSWHGDAQGPTSQAKTLDQDGNSHSR